LGFGLDEMTSWPACHSTRTPNLEIGTLTVDLGGAREQGAEQADEERKERGGLHCGVLPDFGGGGLVDLGGMDGG
jgi:hypothetical protein